MNKLVVILFAFFISLNLVQGLNLSIEKVSTDEVLIADIDETVEFELKITNNAESENIQFYNLVGFRMEPSGEIEIEEDESKNIILNITPIDEFNERGKYTFEYFIRGEDIENQIKKTLTFDSIDLNDAFKIGASSIDTDENKVEVFIENKYNYDFDDIEVSFSSVFFDQIFETSLEANSKESFDIDLNNDEIDDIQAGFYTLKAVVAYEGVEAVLEGSINFPEKDDLRVDKSTSGFFIVVEAIKNINEGNVEVLAKQDVERNIFTRLFTSFNPEPDAVDRKDLTIVYTWVKKLRPGEDFEVKVKTNWLLPFFVIILIVAIIILVKKYSQNDLILRKKISFVKAKGGEFALKVMIFVKAEKFVENVNVIDRLPRLVKLYPKFGREQPSRVDDKGRKVEWNFDSLEAGEVRVLNYLIYSKVGVLGKFALPIATAIYDKEGNIKETSSNRTYFVSEPAPGSKEDE